MALKTVSESQQGELCVGDIVYVSKPCLNTLISGVPAREYVCDKFQDCGTPVLIPYEDDGPPLYASQVNWFRTEPAQSFRFSAVTCPEVHRTVQRGVL